MIKNFSKVIDAKNQENRNFEFDYGMLSKFKQLIKDDSYFEFIIESDNGGFFFDQSLHIYGFTQDPDFHNIEVINMKINQEYGDIAKDLMFFGQDVFGNQFSFDLKNKQVIFFNIETGEREILASSFLDWIPVLLNQINYLTGNTLASEWSVHQRLELDQRLSPKIPFVTGGQYSLSNLYASNFPDYIKSNANIARQVVYLPEGTQN